MNMHDQERAQRMHQSLVRMVEVIDAEMALLPSDDPLKQSLMREGGALRYAADPSTKAMLLEMIGADGDSRGRVMAEMTMPKMERNRSAS
jgi:hypothetical protein